MRTILVWLGAVLMVGGLWSASVIMQGLADEPAAPSSSSEATEGAAGKETGGSEAVPPMVEGEPALPAEAGEVQERALPPTGEVTRKSVVLYQGVNFGGQSRTLGIGTHRFYTPADWNDVASSIKIDNGLVALLYEHADDGGGYGIGVDLLEDRPDLSQVSFNNKLSYITVFSSPNPKGLIWVRNSVQQNGRFLPGHWELPRASGTPVNTMAVVSPPKPPNIRPPGIGPFTSTLTPSDQYYAPTANLTAVATALSQSLKYKGLTTVITLPPGLLLTQPVEITIWYTTPGSPIRVTRQTQPYSSGFGNRFVYHDPEGEGKKRRLGIQVGLTEPNKPGGGLYGYGLSGSVDLDPLYAINISPLTFTLLTDCDPAGGSEILVIWYTPDAARYLYNAKSISMSPGRTVVIQEFAWHRTEVDAAAHLHMLSLGFEEHDPNIDIIPPYSVPGQWYPLMSTVNLVPGKTQYFASEMFSHQYTPYTPDRLVGPPEARAGYATCMAKLEYRITYALRTYPNL